MPIEQNVRSRHPTSVEGWAMTFGRKFIRPWSNGFYAAKRIWRSASITQQFLFLALVIAVAPMTVLGILVNHEIKTAKIGSIAAVEAFHFRMVAEPLLGEAEFVDVLPEDIEQELDAWFAAQPGGTVESTHIWLRDGTVAYSTKKQLVAKQFTNSELKAAFTGELLADMELTDYGAELPAANTALLEIYIPLRDLASGEILAVGEVYRRIDGLADQLRQTGFTVWGIVGGVTALMILLSLVIVRKTDAIVTVQSTELKRRLTRSGRLAKFNARLRHEAVQTRIEAIKTNEALLNQIGSDLHDGPIQLLSLLVLQLEGTSELAAKAMASGTASRQEKNIQLARDTIRELRNLSHGLILPELDNLDPEEALRLAIIRHQDLTGTNVEAEFHHLPDKIAPILKICLYRVVQESLTNAFRHAGGFDQQVIARALDGHIEVQVSNGPGASEKSERRDQTAGMGMLGLSKRVAAADGELTVHTKPDGGTNVTVRLPFELNEQSVAQMKR